jgi:hypothetical protein
VQQQFAHYWPFIEHRARNNHPWVTAHFHGMLTYVLTHGSGILAYLRDDLPYEVSESSADLASEKDGLSDKGESEALARERAALRVDYKYALKEFVAACKILLMRPVSLSRAVTSVGQAVGADKLAGGKIEGAISGPIDAKLVFVLLRIWENACTNDAEIEPTELRATIDTHVEALSLPQGTRELVGRVAHFYLDAFEHPELRMLCLRHLVLSVFTALFAEP